MLKIAIAQANLLLGDFASNVRRITGLAQEAAKGGADILLTPELSLCGYPPEDLLLRPDFYRAAEQALRDLCDATKLLDIFLIVGLPQSVGDQRFNAYAVVHQGKPVAFGQKQFLPQYEVFDEQRYFASGTDSGIFNCHGVQVGVLICEDIWYSRPIAAIKAKGAQIALVLNASPYHLDKSVDRQSLLETRAREVDLPIIYCNMVGGQDELVFDGGSLAVSRHGDLVARFEQFGETLAYVDAATVTPDAPLTLIEGSLAPTIDLEEQIYHALVLGVRDYFAKNRFPGAYLGLSGGIDSALTLCIAVDALGAEHVRPIIMPSPYTAQMSVDDSLALCENLGVTAEIVEIEPLMNAYRQTLNPFFHDQTADTTEENIQARIRGNLLMALSNKSGWLVLTTGNKSEMAVGYCTLYGDMAGGFAVLKDLLKTRVYDVSRWINRAREIIPWRIIDRPPSAELRPDQTDQDSLPPYEVLDAIVMAYMERDVSPREIVGMGYAKADVQKVIRLLRISEYKRRQSPVGIRLTRRGFGKDWRYPITNRYADEW